MKTRPLGKTGIDIAEIGLGAWGLGGAYYGEISWKTAVATVKAYIDAGGTHIDTAYSYQRSEEIIGEALKGYDRSKLIITSKSYAGSYNLSDVSQLRHQFETSLKGLGVDYLDIYMMHGSPADPDHMHRLCDEFDKLKAEGKVRVIGASIPGPEVTDERLERAVRYAESGRVEVLQLNYSIARQKLGEVFSVASANGVGVICRWVIESGMITGKYQPGHEFAWPDTRNRYTPEERDAMLQLGLDLGAMLPEGYDNAAQVAIAFPLADPNVSGVILGATSPQQVQRNCVMDALPPLPDDLMAYLKATYGPLNDCFNPTGAFEHVDGRLGATLR